MGYATKPDTRGLYYLQTAGSSPYGLGVNGIKYRNTDGIVKNLGNIGAGVFG